MLVADFTNPMFFEVVRGAERAAADRGYTMILSESQESADREARTADRVIPSVDGLILVTTRLRDEQIRELSDRKPLVVINREVTGVDSIVPRLEPGIGEALDLLAAQGHRSMAFLSGPQRAWMSRARWDVLFDGATRRGMRIVEIPSSAPTIEGGRDAMKRVVASGVTAVVAYNDLIAIGLLQGVQGSGGQVPRDLSIIGFDDIFGSDFTSPPLTTVMTPLGLMGERAVEVLLDGEGGGAAGEGARPPDSKLVLRGSVGPALLG
ncbi:LacI family transcriptional regulator [Frondihabitans sucicola]|uniref:LacI family transcriptional regulator n=1 Tax=Frondihabitans sucicola TaxID=1268041 RepID=A0ABN6XWN3_9MICO|nr:substrate-binding domain-containing protein [Frondihabitans sucicola]BDZ49363.1 LacI family transcriptional regulator [Frondihabitans sucicola]